VAKKQEVQKQEVIEEELNKLFSAEWLRKTAKETGFVKRERKIDPALMFWVLVLGFGVQIQKREPLRVHGVPTKKKERCISVRQLLRTLHARTCEVSSCLCSTRIGEHCAGTKPGIEREVSGFQRSRN